MKSAARFMRITFHCFGSVCLPGCDSSFPASGFVLRWVVLCDFYALVPAACAGGGAPVRYFELDGSSVCSRGQLSAALVLVRAAGQIVRFAYVLDLSPGVANPVLARQRRGLDALARCRVVLGRPARTVNRHSYSSDQNNIRVRGMRAPL